MTYDHLLDLQRLGGGGGAAAASPSLAKTVVVEGTGGAQYKSEPQPVYCGDGSLLVLYRHGTGHVENTGVFRAIRSTDHGETWGESWLVLDHASGFDTRNPAMGIDTDSGRLIAFGRAVNAGTHNDTFYITSMDHGASWSAPTSLTSALPFAAMGPFGPVLNTTLGLIQAFYTTDQICILRSADGGQTWGNQVTVVNNTASTADLGEPFMIDLGSDRIVMTCRSEGTKGAFTAFMSSDGGATWSYLGALYNWTSTTIDTASPLMGCKLNDDTVFLSWYGRHQHNKNWYLTYPLEVFHEEPGLAWLNANSATYPTEPRHHLFVGYRRMHSITTAVSRDSGYTFPIMMPNVTDRVLVFWYDTKDGTDANTSIYCMRTPLLV